MTTTTPSLALDDVLAEASRRAGGRDDLGDGPFLDGLQRFLDSLEQDARLNDVGRIVASERALVHVVNRLNYVGDRKAYPEIAEQRAHTQAQLEALEARWAREKALVQEIGALRTQLESAPVPAAASSQGNAGPSQVSLTPAGGGLGAAQPWGRSDVCITRAPPWMRAISHAEYAPRPVPSDLPAVAYFWKKRPRTAAGTAPALWTRSTSGSLRARSSRTRLPSGAASTAFFTRLASRE